MKRKKKRKNKSLIAVIIIVIAAFTSCLLFYLFKPDGVLISDLKKVKIPEYVDEQLLPIGSSRMGRELSSIKGIVIHYVGNPGTTAQQNHDYFGNDGTEVNSHFVVGLDGEIIQCVPIYERSVASNHRNKDTISIEVCHPDSGGRFTNATRKSLIKLTAWLCEVCELDTSNIIRHYDITGKLCPLYYVENEDAWEELLNDIDVYIKNES